MSNIYYSPEDFGLVTVGEFDFAEPYYSFDMCVVWHNAAGFWIGCDSGCSCPSPFDGIYDVNELDGPHDLTSLRSRLTYLVNDRGFDDYYGYSRNTMLASVQELVDRAEQFC